MPYLETHAKRYACMLHEIRKIRSYIKNDPIVSLDIGPSFHDEDHREPAKWYFTYQTAA